MGLRKSVEVVGFTPGVAGRESLALVVRPLWPDSDEEFISSETTMIISSVSTSLS